MLKKLEQDMMQALKSKEKEKAGALRLIISKCKNKAIELRKELSDQEIIKVLQTVAKQHKESIKLYKEGNRNDLVEAEVRELGFVEVYLPSMMSEEDLRGLVSSVVAEVGATSMADFGKVMPNVMKQGAGKIDGNTAQSIVKELLS
ncbi:MAG: GatB/YqeY domain-containing protein [Candidatus Marinimicrobia bacterium]|jgi:uncharacterized protein YqeY|nr:GatB/YqeY domain-containing protein [Candidatus Neomarinimicrobiota bacterium]